MSYFAGCSALRALVGWSNHVQAPEDWSLIANEGTLGLVADFHRQQGWALPPEVLKAFLQCVAFQMRCSSLLGQLSESLPEVRILAFKGCALAYTLYPRAGQRNFGDIDIAIEPRNWPIVTDALKRYGFLPGLEAGEYDRGGLRVDLHTHPLGQILPLFGSEVSDWWTRSQLLSERTGLVRRLDYEHEFVLCLLHAAKHSFSRTHWFGDLLLLAQELGPERLLQVVAEYRLRRQLGYAEFCLREMFGLSLLPAYVLPRFNLLEIRFLRKVVERKAPAFLGMLTPLSAAGSRRKALRFFVRSLYPSNKGLRQRTQQLLGMAWVAWRG